MSFQVLRKGIYTTVQDLGRYGYRKCGVVQSGAMDQFAMRAANLLVGNVEKLAVLEGTLIGPKLLCEEDTLTSVCGADVPFYVNGSRMPLWRPIAVKQGDILQFGAVTHGCRSYLAVAGGFDVSEVMGSRSTYVRAAIGGYEGRALQDGDHLETGAPSALSVRLIQSVKNGASWGVSPYIRPAYREEPVIRVVPGAHYERFTKEAQEKFFTKAFSVTADSDRMGYRLDGSNIFLEHPLELLSEAVTFGTIQVPPKGRPIILMADCQTTGGYPKLGTVATVDLPLLAQVKPGERIRFQEITIAKAQQLLYEREQHWRELRAGITLKGGK